MHLAVIGAGPAGLTCVKQALADGHDVVCYEKHQDLGGIWNPASGGAYAGVRMQSSRMSMPFSDHPPGFAADFPTQDEVQAYLRSYAEDFGLLDSVRFGHEVVRVAKDGGRWRVTARHSGGAGEHSEHVDAVLVANGELWRPRLPDGGLPPPGTGVRVLTAPEYRGPAAFAGQRILVVGGGVSGADIAADLAPHAARVDWSVRREALFLPRSIAGAHNDALFSYAGRVAVEEVPYAVYLDWLAEWLPEYMRMYRATGLLPQRGFHGAVHINEKIVPAVYGGEVHPVPALAEFTADGRAVLADGTGDRYDAVVLCLGYEPPDYGFIDALRREDLYEHHFWRHDPTLAVVNTPVDTEAFGTACPYFEAVAGWVLSVFGGKATLPGPAERAEWCARHMSALHDRRYLDCWLETIRLGLLSGALPDPAVHFRAYWALVSSQVDPANLRPGRARSLPAVHDGRLDLAGVRHRVLAALPAGARERLLAHGEIDAADLTAAARVPAGRELAPWLPYRQRDSGPAGPAEGRAA
ncbi:FAD-dependent oxidoreductase [Streptomyces sp. HC44]|uniref:FAD-dependent oxidoreductase n=1 Tax=Streptomyces scabichelini TaxID=2711217 RepID=A0A6G4UYR8_9ACTN|nr:FAD-dependent oxidoreductase [Streptomyces scabichelini]NGO06901.1 FAD-dependent oxidoreductase [Streptomyces scabichelini]